MAVQRSITTPSPPVVRDPGGLPVDDAELEPEAPGRRPRPPRAHAGTHSSDRRKTSTMSNGPVAATASASVGKAGTPWTSRSFGLTGTHSKPCADEVREDAERRPARVRRRADHRDPAGARRTPLDARVVEERDRAAPLLEVEDTPRARGRRRPVVGVRSQPRARTAGRRRPAGCSARPRRRGRRSSRGTAGRRRTAPGSG